MKLTIVSLLLYIGIQIFSVGGLDNGLARTPPMGWLSWERFRCNIDCKNDPDNCISENLYKKMADLMVAEGFKDFGYEYVNIDDCWMAKERDAEGRLQPDPDRFPSGMKALADYVHSKGLKLGIYEDFGLKTCGGYPGSLLYMESDANSFAEWDIDMLKFDGCNSDPHQMDVGYPIMGQFLNRTGRPILYACSWPSAQWVIAHIKPNYSAVREHCNIWRVARDVQDSWVNVQHIIDVFGTDDSGFSPYTGPGGFADPDMLVVGDFGLSFEEQKTQFVLWCMWSAPLFMSTDLRTLTNQSKALLQHPGLLAINQDARGVQAKRLWQVSNVGMWLKPLAKEGTYALAVVNRDDQGQPLKLDLQITQMGLPGQSYNFTDVYENRYYGHFTVNDKVHLEIDPLGVFVAIAVPT